MTDEVERGTVDELEHRLATRPADVLDNNDGFINVDLGDPVIEILCRKEALAMQRHLQDVIAASKHPLRCTDRGAQLTCVQSTQFPWVILMFDRLPNKLRLVVAMSGTPNGVIDQAVLREIRDAAERTRGHCP